MFCEFCGRPVHERRFSLLGGERVVACEACGGKLDTTSPSKGPRTDPLSGRGLGPPAASLDEGLDIPVDVGTRIRATRSQKGLTIEELALALREKASVVQKIENNRLVPSDAQLAKLERLFGCRLREKE